jgi:hypothetical protein
MTAPLTVPPRRPAELLRQRQSELDALFELLPAPTADQADGAWRGTLMAITGLNWLPRGIAAVLYQLLALPINPWRGKSFDHGSGANRWFGMPGAAFASYRVSVDPSPVDGKPAVELDYDLPENLALLRPIRGEARLLGENLLLCRMNWQGKAGLYRVLYFTLARAQ